MHRVMSVGQCNPDHFSLKSFLEKNFICEIIRIDSTNEALEELRKNHYDLVIVNRKLDIDYSDGLLLIQKMQENSDLSKIPAMLLSNYPEAQKEATENGGILGFGKLDYGKPETVEKIRGFLPVLNFR